MDGSLSLLLAYLDDTLDPDESRRVQAALDDDPATTRLMHRIGDVMRRMRLGAPTADGGVDPNSVAEYLDQSMSADRARDFERICLESDEHLAELAACHQVLAIILGEPAAVDPESRRRMYALANEPERMPVAPLPPFPPIDPPPPVERQSTEPPTHAPRRSRFWRRRKKAWQVLLARWFGRRLAAGELLRSPGLFLIALLLAVLAGWSVVMLSPRSELTGTTTDRSFEQSKERDTVDADEPIDVATPATDVAPLDVPDVEAASSTIVVRPIPPPTWPFVAPTPRYSTIDVAEEEPVAAAPPNDESTGIATPPIEVQPHAAIAWVDQEATQSPAPTTNDQSPWRRPPTTNMASTPAPPSGIGEATISDEQSGESEPASDQSLALMHEDWTVGVWKNILAEESAEAPTILFARDRPESPWRLAHEDGDQYVRVGATYAAAAGFKPLMALPNGLTVELIDGARIRMLRPGADGTPNIALEEGRIVMRTTPPIVTGPRAADRPIPSLHVQFDRVGWRFTPDATNQPALELEPHPRSGLLGFLGDGSQVDITASLVQLPIDEGANVQHATACRLAIVPGPGARALWRPTGHDTVAADGPTILYSSASDTPGRFEATPFTPGPGFAEATQTLTPRAAQTLHRELLTASPSILSALADLMNHHSEQQVRAAAMNCLVMMQEFSVLRPDGRFARVPSDESLR